MTNIKIYTTSWCGPCKMAKRLLDDKGLKFEEIDIEKIDWSRDDLFQKTGGRTVPQIVIEGKTIGGFDDLLKMEREGKL
ncbi:MAG: glutaredoxin [Candidatus Marinimicrobia bacterium]|nr:glutaredoxin [Candidatus Neomarinimicrobiota bacterium]|tara:strand:+ start:3718 stop:3954 length:237 start_codon:yes stop_codon:yes gene_type:complete